MRRARVHDYLHVAVDDHSRWAFVQVHPDERGETTAAFLAAAAVHFAKVLRASFQLLTTPSTLPPFS